MATEAESDQTELHPTDFLTLLRDKINLTALPFTERGSRIMVFADSSHRSLYVKLAERWVRREQQFGNYRVRVPILSDLSFTDDSATPLALHWTTYPDRIELTTSQGASVLTFQDAETLYIALPSGRTNLSLLVHAVADIARSDRRGGEIEEGRGGRNIAYTTTASILSNSIEKEDSEHWRVRVSLDAAPGAALTINITPRLGFNRVVPPRDEVARVAAERWTQWFAAAPPVPEVYWRQYYYA